MFSTKLVSDSFLIEAHRKTPGIYSHIGLVRTQNRIKRKLSRIEDQESVAARVG